MGTPSRSFELTSTREGSRGILGGQRTPTTSKTGTYHNNVRTPSPVLDPSSQTGSVLTLAPRAKRDSRKVTQTERDVDYSYARAHGLSARTKDATTHKANDGLAHVIARPRRRLSRSARPSPRPAVAWTWL